MFWFLFVVWIVLSSIMFDWEKRRNTMTEIQSLNPSAIIWWPFISSFWSYLHSYVDICIWRLAEMCLTHHSRIVWLHWKPRHIGHSSQWLYHCQLIVCTKLYECTSIIHTFTVFTSGKPHSPSVLQRVKNIDLVPNLKYIKININVLKEWTRIVNM